jgi:LAO/AO transport system kinase
MNLATSVLAGERLALARLLSKVENNTQEGLATLNELFPHTGRAHLVGVTGAPGTGKSSLVNQLAYFFRHPPEEQTSRTVAIIAVDPSSPFTGGAILGDRVRMQDLAGDQGVFIRSMAARGSLGGLASATASLVQIFDAAGYEIIFIETVGAGQAEVDIARLAHSTIVVEAPGLGDEIQSIKAGILEIADILVVNKADRPGVESTERALRNMLQLGHPITYSQKQSRSSEKVDLLQPQTGSPLWIPPVLCTVATQGDGVSELVKAIFDHRQYLHDTGQWEQKERNRLKNELDNLLRENLVARWRATIQKSDYQHVLDSLVARRISPHQAVVNLLDGSSPGQS